jgi:hypothetical protein
MRRVILVLLPLAIVLALVLWRVNGVAPQYGAAPGNEFSAGRALGILSELLNEQVPHPVGTAANKRVRERIEARFRMLGYDVDVQRRFACSSGAACAMVENVIAMPPGAAKGDIVILTAHYDSVPSGPGASDDGQGIATMLEVARAIRGEKFRNRVAFLATDGEEIGLVGAEAFVADPQRLRDVKAVISVEMRGTYGGSTMFETSEGNRWLIRHLASALSAPQASSVFYSIYKLLPNDTDVTVFKRAGLAAINFGAIRGVNWYHTPFDDLAHTSARTLQHHGENALGTLRVLANADLDARSSTDATYFDVLGFFLVWWPQEWTLWIAIVSLVALVIAVRRTNPRAMTFGVLAAFATLLVAGVGGMALAQLAQLQSDGASFVAHPLPSVIAMWLGGIAAALLASAAFNRRDDVCGLLYGIAIVWHTIGIALAVTLPGATYLFIVPALAVTICAWVKATETTTAVVSATIAAILFFPFGVVLYDALGSRMMAAIAVLMGAFATLVAPLFPRYRNGFAAAALALVAALIAIAQPAYTKEKPRSFPITYVDDVRAKQPRWMMWDVPDGMPVKFERADPSLAPWNQSSLLVAPAPAQPMPRVTMSGTRNGSTVTIRVRSPRRADRLVLLARGGTVRRVNGVAPPPGRGRTRSMRGWSVASAAGVDEMVVELAANGPVEAAASDITFSLPPSAAPLLRARAAANGSTSHDGDTTLTRAWGNW